MKKILTLFMILFLAGCDVEPVEAVVEIDFDAEIASYLQENLEEEIANHLANNIEAYLPEGDVMNLNELLIEAIALVDSSVLAILNLNDIGQPNGSGSAVVYKSDDGYYYAVTNNHVVEGSVELKIYFSDYTYVSAELIGADYESDLAVIRFITDREIGISSFGDISELKKGQIVFAIGSPSGLTYYNSVTTGIIGGLDRFIGIEDSDNDGIDDVFVKMLQHDAAINPGNSGGPLFNLQGEIIGINTIKLVSDDIEGMGFSIPTDIAKRVISDLEEFGVVKRTRLGVWIADVLYMSDPPEGIELGANIAEVVLGGPADLTSDLQDGDTIIEFGGIVIDGVYRLKDVMFMYHPGDEVEIKYYRDGIYATTTIILGEK